MAYSERDDREERAVINRGLAEPAVMAWVEGTHLLPGWIGETESEVRSLNRIAEVQEKRIEALESQMQTLIECFDRISNQKR